jgi:hypothetical protein
MKIDRQLLEDLDRLYNIPEFRRLRTWMQEQKTDIMAKAINAVENPDALRGRAQQQMDLADLFENAPKELRRLENRTNGTQKPRTTRYT